jgi:hypothetical protein
VSQKNQLNGGKMKARTALVLLSIILAVLAACGGAATAPEPAIVATSEVVADATAAPTEPAATPLPTEEPAAEPTAEPTAESPGTVEPSPTPLPMPSPTKEPLPEISLETITGMFNQFDTEAGGNNWLLFNADGTFVGRHGPTFDTGVPVTEGTFTLEGDVLTLVDPDQCPTGESYLLAYRTQTQVHFEVVGEVTCDYLAQDTQRLPNWKRFEE